jgi:predicted DNA-binding transcriptional regulator YafY
VVAAAQLKLLAALPTELRARASRLVERFHLDAAGWFQPGETVEHLTAIAQAVWDSHRVEIAYDRGDRLVERTVDPLGLVLKGGVWYFVGLVDGQVRTYRAARVVDLELTGQIFERPAGFDLASHWGDNTAAYERDHARTDLTVRIAPHRTGDLRDLLGDEVLASAERLPDGDPQGWTRLRLRVRFAGEALGRLMVLGGDFEVTDPPELRERLVELARATVERHAGQDETLSADASPPADGAAASG